MRRIQCSTPDGITESFTGNQDQYRPASHGAQRLTASLNLSHSTSATAEPVIKCSTPDGITESFTRRTQGRLYVNRCAQRLTASLNLSLAWRGFAGI